MRSSNTPLVIKALAVIILLLVLTGCLKKIEEADELTTNIFDREYTGDQWYNVNEVSLFTNDLGQNKARFDVVIPNENLPELKPSNVQVWVSGYGGDSTAVLDFVLTGSSLYKSTIDLPYAGATADYCVTLGIYLEDENDVINKFSGCYNL